MAAPRSEPCAAAGPALRLESGASRRPKSPRRAANRAVTTAKATLSEKELDLDLRHNVLQDALFQRLESQYGKDNVSEEQPSGAGTRIDIMVRVNEDYWFYEIKTALTPRACLREAIGQLLEYGFWPGGQEPSRLIVVGESRIDEDGQEYLRRLKDRFSLPIEYEAIDVSGPPRIVEASGRGSVC